MRTFSRTVLFLCLCALLLSACTHRIIRTAYAPARAAAEGCVTVTTRDLGRSDSLAKLGEIELKDTGFSTRCSESDALAILGREACALNAQVIHIYEERRPDRTSSCYRCKASFYQNRGSASVAAAQHYSSENVRARTDDDRRRNKQQMTASVFGGILGAAFGILLVSLITN